MTERTTDPVTAPASHPGTAGALSAVRACYLAAAGVAADLLERPEVRDRWDEPSVLELMTVGDLAAHLARSVHLVADFLDAPAPAGEGTATADVYFARFDGLSDLDGPLNTGVRDRSRAAAAAGPDSVARHVRDVLEALPARFEAEPPDRLVLAYAGMPMLLDEFLRTRFVELCVHGEDLELSVGLGPGVDAADDVADMPDDALAQAVDLLLAVARRRHGDAAVLRALARRERDGVDALRVF